MRDSYLEDFFTFLRFPSISTDNAYKEKLAEAPLGWWRTNGIGLEASWFPPQDIVIWAKNKHHRPQTVMLTGTTMCSPRPA